MTNSSTSSTTGTSTNPSNTSSNVPTSGTSTSSLREGDQQNTGTEQLAGKQEGAEGGPPPHPGKHEGRPSTTWTPPFVGNTANSSQVWKMWNISNMEDERPNETSSLLFNGLLTLKYPP